MSSDTVYVQRRRDKAGKSYMTSSIVRRTPSHEELRALLHYDPETGVFRHLRTRGKGKAGAIAGSPSKKFGYVYIRLCNRLFPAHRLAWFYMTGELPELPFSVDHINGNRLDNRWINLRLATYEQQAWNVGAARICKSGLKGAWPCKTTGRWQSIIGTDGKRVFLGRFDTAEEAHAAYMKAAREQRGQEWERAQ